MICLRDMHVWVDALHAVHENMRGHTGWKMSMGTVTVHSKSSKQKLNTRSTTESEVVGVSEYLPYDIWQMNFSGNRVMIYKIIIFIKIMRLQ